MADTKQNLMDAFAGESQANRKYLAYADKADKEGFAQVAKLFRAAAHAETIHAHAHMRLAGMIGGTLANLEDAIAGETHEFTHMYPEMIKQAETEGNKAAASYMKWVNAVEEEHANLYKKALAAKGKTEDVDYYVCSVCGHTHEGPHDGPCPVCNAPAKAFEKMA